MELDAVETEYQIIGAWRLIGWGYVSWRFEVSQVEPGAVEI